MSDERVARMQCPVGLPGVTGKQPEVIALAVVAQLLQQAAARAAVLSPDAPRLRTTA